MRSHLLSLVLLLASALPVFAQDADAAPPAPRPEVPGVPDTADEALKGEVELALQHVLFLRDDVDEVVGDLQDLETGLTKSVQRAEHDLASFREAYGDAEDRPEPPSLEDVAQRLSDLRRRLEKARTSSEAEEAQRRRSRLESIRDDAQERLGALPSRYAAWRARARAAAADGAWSADDDEAWGTLQGGHAVLLQSLLGDVDAAISLHNDCRTLRDRLRAARESTVRLLRRENLMLRGKTDITVQALSQGLQDVKEIPDWLTATGRSAADAVGDASHAGAIATWAGAALLSMVLLVVLRRRVRRRYRQPEELTSDVERSQDLLWRLTGPALWGTALAVPFLYAAWFLEPLPGGWKDLLLIVGVSVGLFWWGRVATRRLLPAGDAWSPLEIDARSRMLVRTGVQTLLWLSVVLVPIGVALLELGYDNRGARQAVWTLYKLLAVVVLLLFVLRRGVLVSIMPPEKLAVGRVLRRAVAVVHPVLVLVGPVLLALDFLQYDVLAEFLFRLVAGVLVAGAVAFFAYGAIWRGLSAWLRSVISEPPDVTAETSRVEAALAIGRYLLLVVVVVGSFFVMLLVQGGDLAAVHDLLDVDLPFQGQIEGKHITWFNVLAGTALMTVFLTAVPKLKLGLERFVLPRTALDSGLRYTISTLIGYVFAAMGIYVGLVQIFDLGAIGYVFAALSVGIGFGLQEIVSNFVSGLILLFERPIKVGDLITVGDTEGWVTKINIRATTIQTRDNVSMLIPNKDFITQAVVNSVYGDTILRVKVNVGVAYGSDTALVEKLMLQAAKEHPLVLADRRTEVAFRDFGASSLDFTLLCWIPEAAEHMRVASALRFKIDALFREHGVEIPFSQHDLHLRSVDEGAAARLRGTPSAPAAGDDPEPADDDPPAA